MVNYNMQAVATESYNSLIEKFSGRLFNTDCNFYFSSDVICLSFTGEFTVPQLKKMQVLYTERCSKDYNKDYL